MQDQLQFTIGYIWVKIFNNASRDINLLLFVKMYCKTFIKKKMEKQSATH